MSKSKKGFTIVELVIVIAVIAILAAVLIPTFSSLIQKANLSSDKQAVREMNLALAADEKLHGKAINVEAAMRVLANAGYNSKNWVCLTSGYEVYWFVEDNRLVLYNATLSQAEYPAEYTSMTMIDQNNNFFVYNQNNMEALDLNFKLDSNSKVDAGKVISGDAAATKSMKTALESISNALGAEVQNGTLVVTKDSGNEALKSALGISKNDTVHVNGATEVIEKVSENVYASIQILSVSKSGTPDLKSNGEIRENVFYISTSTEGATDAEKKAAAVKAGKLVYATFAKANTGAISMFNQTTGTYEGVNMIFAPNTVIDITDTEWAPVKEFTGYFGTSNASTPVIIDGAYLSASTGYSQTVRLNGTGSKYFITGFFGTVFGDALIENVTFRNMNINKPAQDYVLTAFDRDSNLINCRNTVGVVGGVTDKGQDGVPADVVLRNINIEASCTVTSQGCAGGLVGYVGSANSTGKLNGTLLIDNCTVSATVVSEDNASGSGYGAAGGVIGFTCRCKPTTVNEDTEAIIDGAIITIKNTTFNGKVEGYRMVGAAVGNQQGGRVIFEGTNSFAGTLDSKGNAQYVGGIFGTVTSATGAACSIDFGSATPAAGLPAYWLSSSSKPFTVAGVEIVS